MAIRLTDDKVFDMISNISNKTTRTEEKVDNLKVDISEIKEDIKSLCMAKNDHEKRIYKLEARTCKNVNKGTDEEKDLTHYLFIVLKYTAIILAAIVTGYGAGTIT